MLDEARLDLDEDCDREGLSDTVDGEVFAEFRGRMGSIDEEGVHRQRRREVPQIVTEQPPSWLWPSNLSDPVRHTTVDDSPASSRRESC